MCNMSCGVALCWKKRMWQNPQNHTPTMHRVMWHALLVTWISYDEFFCPPLVVFLLLCIIHSNTIWLTTYCNCEDLWGISFSAFAAFPAVFWPNLVRTGVAHQKAKHRNWSWFTLSMAWPWHQVVARGVENQGHAVPPCMALKFPWLNQTRLSSSLIGLHWTSLSSLLSPCFVGECFGRLQVWSGRELRPGFCQCHQCPLAFSDFIWSGVSCTLLCMGDLLKCQILDTTGRMFGGTNDALSLARGMVLGNFGTSQLLPITVK